MSAVKNATLDKVYTRWPKIQIHLTAQSRQNSFCDEINNFLMEIFRPQLKKQTNSAHRSVHYLHPMNLHKRLDLLRQNEILAF